MDKETEKRLAKLEQEMGSVQEELKSWNKLVKDAVTNVVLWLLKAGVTGALLGWCLPEGVRKAIMEWASK